MFCGIALWFCTLVELGISWQEYWEYWLCKGQCWGHSLDSLGSALVTRQGLLWGILPSLSQTGIPWRAKAGGNCHLPSW